MNKTKTELKKLKLTQLRKMYEDKLKQAYVDALSNEKKLEATIKREMEKIISSSAAIIAQEAIGFSNRRWGEWEVDHCNGRKTALANELGKYAFELVKQEIEKQKDKIYPETFTRKQILGLREEMQEQVHRIASHHLSDLAEVKAKEIIKAVVESKENTDDEGA
jgi:hypothetical protein